MSPSRFSRTGLGACHAVAISLLLWAGAAGAAESSGVEELEAPAIEWSLAPAAGADERGAVVARPLAQRAGFSFDRSRINLTIRRTQSSPVSMVFEQVRYVHDVADAAAAALTTTSTRVGFEFRRPSNEARFGVNVFRIHLAGGSTLLLRPRRSGLAVHWRTEF